MDHGLTLYKAFMDSLMAGNEWQLGKYPLDQSRIRG